MRWLGVEYLLAGRMRISRDGSAAIMQRVATIGIAVSLAVMIISAAVVSGFKSEITSKVEAFVSHYEVVAAGNRSGFEKIGISKNEPFIPLLEASGLVHSIKPFALKAGVMSLEGAIEGVMLKGVDSLYDTSFFESYLQKGAMPRLRGERAKEILISSVMARNLGADVGDRVRMMFLDSPPRRDIFTVSGVYDTSLGEFDKQIAVVDLRDVQRLNGWSEDMVTGFELLADGFSASPERIIQIEEIVYDNESDERPLVVEDMRQRYIAIFEWLDIQDINIVIITVIMLIVAIFNIVAMMLILLIERTSTIGILKSVGMGNISLQRLFIYRMVPIIGRGMVWGNATALLLCYLQRVTGAVKLSGEGYFLTTVPIEFNWQVILIINAITIVAAVASQVVPTLVISKISPHKAVKYE